MRIVIVHASQTLIEINKGGEGQCLRFAGRAELQRDGDLPKVTQEVCDSVGSWSLTCLVSFQCLTAPPPPFFFFAKFYAKTAIWEQTVTIRSLSLFDISSPGKKQPAFAQPWSLALMRSVPEHMAISWRLTRNQCCISTAKGMCSRDSQAQMLQGSAVLYAACKTLWGTIAGAGGGGGEPPSPWNRSRDKWVYLLHLSRPLPHPLLSRPCSLRTVVWIRNPIQWPPKRAMDFFFSFPMHPYSRRSFSYYIKLRRLSPSGSAWLRSVISCC